MKRVLTADEQNEFFKYCTGTWYNNLFVVAILTGMKPMEITALKKDDIDIYNGIIHVTRSLSYYRKENDEKSTFQLTVYNNDDLSRRDITFDKECKRALQDQLRQQEAIVRINKTTTEYKDYLFLTKRGTLVNSHTIKKAIQVIVNRINMNRDKLEQYSAFPAYCFRDTFIARCVSSGKSTYNISQMLGIDSTQIWWNELLKDNKKC